MKQTIVARQGDVLIFRIDDETVHTDGLTPANVVNGTVVIALGEATGHKHALHGLQPGIDKVFKQNESDHIVIIAGGKNTRYVLTHDEHDPHELPPGKYAFVIQRQWTGRGSRNVAD